jgi:molybdopterin biosynthesis enzyme MoaB
MKGEAVPSREQNIEKVNTKIQRIAEEMSRSRHDLNRCGDLEVSKDEYEDLRRELCATATDEEAQVVVVTAILRGLSVQPD